jgi:hypothetical protein
MVPTESAATRPVLVRWLQRVLGVILGASAFYLLAIDQLSPHHLPGLRWIAFCVFAAAMMSLFLASRFRRAEIGFCLAAVLFGLLAIGDLTIVASSASHATASRR